MNRTKIEWCDYTWNPISGCSPISAGCENCYAAAIAKRFGRPWCKPVYYPERLGGPKAIRKPSRIFVCSTSDLGHADVEQEWLKAIYEVMHEAPQHTYIVLTKRPGFLRYDPPPAECWMGVTVESQGHTSRWSNLYYQAPTFAVKFVSVEPMLSPVTFNGYTRKPDWVIAGPETGAGARPCEDEWIERLADESGAFFDKRKKGWMRREFPPEVYR